MWPLPYARILRSSERNCAITVGVPNPYSTAMSVQQRTSNRRAAKAKQVLPNLAAMSTSQTTPTSRGPSTIPPTTSCLAARPHVRLATPSPQAADHRATHVHNIAPANRMSQHQHANRLASRSYTLCHERWPCCVTWWSLWWSGNGGTQINEGSIGMRKPL